MQELQEDGYSMAIVKQNEKKDRVLAPIIWGFFFLFWSFLLTTTMRESFLHVKWSQSVYTHNHIIAVVPAESLL